METYLTSSPQKLLDLVKQHTPPLVVLFLKLHILLEIKIKEYSGRI